MAHAPLILGETASSVDTCTERLIQSALEECLGGRTSFVVEYGLRLVRNAGKVLVIDVGQIVERGAHREVMATRGRFWGPIKSRPRRQDTSEDGRPRPSRALPCPA